MKTRIFLIAFSLAVLIIFSLFAMRSNVAIGQEQVPANLEGQLISRLDRILDNQEKLFSRLDAMEKELSRQIKVFGKP